MSQYLWIYPEEEPHLTIGGDNKEDKANGGELEEMWPKLTCRHHRSKGHALSVANKDTAPENAIHECK